MSGLSLHIVARHADKLRDVESFGKNDPYARFSLNIDDKDSFKKTTVMKNAGRNVEWNEEITLDNYDPDLHPKLYVEVMDDEHLADAVIGFAAIPLYQVNDAYGRTFKGRFPLHDDDFKRKGTISLTITVTDEGESAPRNDEPEQEGIADTTDDHKSRIKTLKRLEHASDAAAIAVGIGAIFGAKHLLSNRDE
ncbi:hypothetical protein BGX31_009163 [Mortierella sp. GBA43]|nr:hypothetical protein BGX31_009163 [Mortierella sp. GBA43]